MFMCSFIKLIIIESHLPRSRSQVYPVSAGWRGASIARPRLSGSQLSSQVLRCFISNSTCADKWSSLSDNTWGNRVVFIFFRICSSHNSSVNLSRIVSASYISGSVVDMLHIPHRFHLEQETASVAEQMTER